MYSRHLPVIAAADVVVIGSGSAGSSAAIAAGRAGTSVLLMERQGFLGGRAQPSLTRSTASTRQDGSP
jgi:flavin-dependent dehydrogenase